MNDEQFKELEAEEESLWQKVKAAEDAVKPPRDTWILVRQRLDREKLRREILAEPKSNVESVGERV